MKKLYLVDVSSMFFRAYYAIRPLSNPNGLPTNAIYGFLSMTIKLLREVKPDYMAFCFDRPEPSFRRDIDERYKANRSEMPEDLVPQVPYIRQLSEALGIRCVDREKYEADDVIGTLAVLGRDNKVESVIVSGDKDFGQLVDAHISIYDTMKDVRLDSAGVLEKMGVAPPQIIDYLALVGDSSDNVPGVKGIGPKGAQKLLNQFKSLDDIYAHVEDIENKNIKQKLIDGKAEAYLSQKLVTIVTDIALGLSLEELRLQPIDREKLRALLEELDFKAFAKTLLGTDSAEALSEASKVTQTAEPISSSTEPAIVQHWIESTKDIAALDKWLQPETETWALQTERGIYLSQGGEVAHVQGDPASLGEMLTSKKLLWKGADLKSFWKQNHIEHPVGVWDQILAGYIVRSGAIERVEELFSYYNGQNLPELPTGAQLMSAHVNLEKNLRRKLSGLGGDKVLKEIELPLTPVLLAMERKGIAINSDFLREQSRDLGADIQKLDREIQDMAKENFNVASPKQLAVVLFQKMKLPSGKKTKTGFSTDNDVLEGLKAEHPIAEKILQFRELSKLKSTYVDALPVLASPADGRIHTTFNQALTTTGRLSSTNPNLQNIPIRTERGNLIRKAFVAAPGTVLISADYSQIELRVLAHITGDAGLVRAFADDLDIHTATAAEIFNIPLTEVSAEMRRKAKAVNFGLAYGQGVFGLAETLRIPRSEASEIVSRYFLRFPGVRDYMESTVASANQNGFVETIFGRRRYLDELKSKSAMVRKFGERAAINAPIQGAASDLVKIAMIELYKKNIGPMLLQVHDELIFEVPKELAQEFSVKIKSQMESIGGLRVPLKVNTGLGDNWFEAH